MSQLSYTRRGTEGKKKVNPVEKTDIAVPHSVNPTSGPAEVAFMHPFFLLEDTISLEMLFRSVRSFDPFLTPSIPRRKRERKAVKIAFRYSVE